MTTGTREVLYVAGVSAGALLLHRASDLFPLIFTLPALIAYTITSPLVYLIPLAGVTELFSVQPAGIMSLVVFLPYLLSRLVRRVPVDVSVSFFLLVTLTSVTQFVMLVTPDMFRLARAAAGWPFLVAQATMLPWPRLPWLVVPTLLVFASSIIIHFNRR